MTAFALSASSFSIVGKQQKNENSRRDNVVSIVMGDAAGTYPSGGISVLGKYLGCPANIDSLLVIDNGAAGISYTWDATNKKLRAFVTGAHSHDILLKDATQADGATTRVNAAANKLGANTGGDLTITGGGANGGVVSKADVKLSEATTAFVMPTHTIKVRVVGY